MITPEEEPGRQMGCAGWIVGLLLAGVAVVWLALEGAGCGPCSNLPRTFSGQAVDETGAPVPKAEVVLGWSTGGSFNPGKSTSDSHEVMLTTDAAGRVSGKGSGGYFGVTVRKEGYYESTMAIDKGTPTENVRMLLNKVRNPQPMIGKKVKLRLPVGHSRLQYDLVLGDCLPPLGKGLVADLEIEWTRPEVQHGDAERAAFRSRIVGEGNGLIPPEPKPTPEGPTSRLRSLHEAPTEGYQPSADFGNHFRGGNLVAYVKIRTGQPGGPLYGKLLDPLSYNRYDDVDQFRFQYVINPSGDRGMEIDMKRITVPGKRELEYAPEEF